jgi:hypothetical protein
MPAVVSRLRLVRVAGHAQRLVPGFKFIVMALTALPIGVVGLSGDTVAERVSGPMAAVWFALLPVALYRAWAALALPVVATAIMLHAVIALPFNSMPFIIDFWTSALMLVLALPRR